MEKRVKLEDNSEILVQISDAYCGKSIHIYKDYYENNELIKGFTFCMWDDYAFDAWPDYNDYSKEKITFVIDEKDPLFYCFHKLLKENKELIVSSDEYEENIKCFCIRKMDDNKIILEFISKCEKNTVNKYRVFVKNVNFDLRSKIDIEKKYTKKRLNQFFIEAQEILLNDYHQISIDEYMLVKTRK